MQIMLFEAFKKYHNANYHDGDNTFDDEVYKKSNGDDFDNTFVQECFDHFEAAWQMQEQKISKALNMAEHLRAFGSASAFQAIDIEKVLLGDCDE